MLFNRNTYRIDWTRLNRWLIPVPLRKPKTLILVGAIITAINSIYNRFKSYKDYSEYRLLITPQVCFLERMLNDRYDPIERRIWIGDAKVYDYIYLFLKIESKPVKFYKKSEDQPVFIYTRAETEIFGADFIINVPVAVGYNSAELTALVNSYKLASKKFKVVNYV